MLLAFFKAPCSITNNKNFVEKLVGVIKLTAQLEKTIEFEMVDLDLSAKEGVK